MAPPATPRYRFPSPDDVPRPRTDPPRVVETTVQAVPSPAPRPQFATPAPLAARRHLPQGTSQTPGAFKSRNRGFSPDPDFFTPTVNKQVLRTPAAVDSTGSKRRRRSFDLDEIDEALIGSGKPKVLGPSSGGWNYPAEYFGATPVPRRTQVPQATPTPSVRRPMFRQSSAIISSPPEGLNLSFGDTQEDVQDDSEEGESGKSGKAKLVPQRKRQKSAGVFDDIESIASSLPPRDEVEEEGEDGGKEGGPNRKENSAPSRPSTKSGLRTPSKLHKSFVSNMLDSFATSSMPAPPEEGWMAVPDQPQLKLPPKSPTAKLNKAICAMAWSPSHRKRRNANSKYLTGGLAASVLGWAYDAQDLVLRNNMIIEQSPHLHKGSFVVGVDTVWGEENYAAVTGVGEQVRFYEEEDVGTLSESGAEKLPAKVILIGDENSALRKDLRQGSRVEIRPPTWEVAVDGEDWTVGINWRLT
ncbi:hypothetical protein TWF281_005014 [Arthrobotrys megalospora]